MTSPPRPLSERKSWQELTAHYQRVKELHLRKLFADEPGRGERLVLEATNIYFDYSKNRVTDETLRLLVALAEESGLRGRIDAMFAGEHINMTEDRAVLHVALRAPAGSPYARPEVHEVLARMSAFSDRVRSGEWQGATG